MKDLFTVLAHELNRKRDLVLVTIIRNEGSAPQGAGARMLVSLDGLSAGTIGGGAVEYQCIQIAKELLGTTEGRSVSFSLNAKDSANLGMVCGGNLQVLFTPVSGQDERWTALCNDVLERFEMQQPFWMLTPMDAHSIPELWPAGRREADTELPATLPQQLGSQPEIKTLDGKEWFCDQLLKSGRVCIFGGGHVAAALVPVLIPLEFPCVVLENRSEFADPARFPGKCQVQLIDFDHCTEQFSFQTDDYVCIMTRGHLDDLTVLTQILKTEVKYIGLIGSARKIKTTFEKLKDLGFCDEDLKRIITPIGLPIGGRSPAEIAISIAAQLIQCRCEAPSKYWLRRDDT